MFGRVFDNFNERVGVVTRKTGAWILDRTCYQQLKGQDTKTVSTSTTIGGHDFPLFCCLVKKFSFE